MSRVTMFVLHDHHFGQVHSMRNQYTGWPLQSFALGLFLGLHRNWCHLVSSKYCTAPLHYSENDKLFQNFSLVLGYWLWGQCYIISSDTGRSIHILLLNILMPSIYRFCSFIASSSVLHSMWNFYPSQCKF